MNSLPKRLLSIDVFRAITMFLMIFVNDVGGVRDLPSWIDHVEYGVDGMGFADTIFPTFLFIVGLSLPFALLKRMNRGDSFIKTIFHIFSRSFALIVMGFFHVNLESYSSAAMLPHPVWGLLITLSFFLIWLDYKDPVKKPVKYGMMALGAVVLLAMAYLYKGGEPDHLHGMRPSWWGILGIIGWAYLVSACVFVLIKGNGYLLLVMTLLFLGINIASHMNAMPFNIPVVNDASSISLIMMGALVSVLYSRLAGSAYEKLLWPVLTASGLILIIFGLFIRPYSGGISKISSTPAWITICAGIAILFFELMIWLIDLKKKQNWFSLISAAGTSTLTCYLMPYLLYFAFEMMGVWYPHFLSVGAAGILRSFAVSFLLILLVKQMEKKNIRLRI